MAYFKMFRLLFFLLIFVGVATPGRSEGIEDLLHFMNFTLGQTTFDEVQKTWGESKCEKSYRGKNSLSYSVGDYKISFSNLFIDPLRFDKYSIILLSGNSEDEKKCFSEIKAVKLPSNFCMGMSQSDFKKSVENLINASPEYHYFPEFEPDAEVCTFDLEKWDGSCQCVFIDGVFDQKDELRRLTIWTQVTCQGTPGVQVPGEE